MLPVLKAISIVIINKVFISSVVILIYVVVTFLAVVNVNIVLDSVGIVNFLVVIVNRSLWCGY